MFLKKIKRLHKKASFRLTFAFLIFFIPTYLIIFGVFDVVASKHLESKDRDLIENRLQTYQDLFEKEGIEGIRKIISNPRLHNQSLSFFIHISDSNNKTIFIHMPEEELNEKDEFDANYLESKIALFGKKEESQWAHIPSKSGDDEDALEVKSVGLSGGYHLHVGQSTEERDELIEKFRGIFISILVPLIVISVFGAIFITQEILRPLKNLSYSIKKIKAGELSTRSPLPATKDELYDLTATFNDMVDQVESVVRTMKETLDNIAHDLKTPLTRNRMVSELAIQKNSHADLKSAAEENIENTDSMLKMVQAIMEVARLDSNTLVLHKEKFSSNKVFDEILDLYFFVAEEKNIHLNFSSPDVEIYADRLMFKQALANLIDNAIKYSANNSFINLSCTKVEDELQFIVEDKGIGIAEEEIPRIWERLYRADRSRHEPGLGLGLSMVKIFVESHQGRIKVESMLGAGSKFIVILPQTV